MASGGAPPGRCGGAAFFGNFRQLHASRTRLILGAAVLSARLFVLLALLRRCQAAACLEEGAHLVAAASRARLGKSNFVCCLPLLPGLCAQATWLQFLACTPGTPCGLNLLGSLLGLPGILLVASTGFQLQLRWSTWA